jgi:hypothetical protein
MIISNDNVIHNDDTSRTHFQGVGMEFLNELANQPGMNQRLYVLRRLICIDSYRPGSITQIECDGHTSLTGRNGNGKTTLLKLIPIFWGSSPNDLVKGGGVNKSFVDFYLPRSTSYVIFEYVRNGLYCMVVLHASSNGEKVHYRFVGHEYTKARFVDDDGQIVAGADLLKHLSKRSEHCTEIISSRRDYRSIIQNTVTKREHRSYAARYSFTTTAGKTAHLEKIVTGMFKRETSFFDLKKVIVSCSDEDETGKVPLRTSQSELDEWVRDLRAYRAVMERQGRLADFEQAALQYKTAVIGLATVHSEFQHLERRHGETIGTISQLLESLASQLKLHDGVTHKRQQELSNVIGALEGRIKNFQEQIDNLDNQHKAYAAEHIEILAEEVASIPTMEADIDKLKVRIDALLGDAGKIANIYATLKNEKMAEFNAFKGDQESLKDPLRSEAGEKEDEARQRTGEEWRQVEEEIDQKVALVSDQRDELNTRIGTLRERIKNPQASSDSIDAELKAREAFESASDAANNTVQGLREADDALRKLRQEYEQTTLALKGLRNRKQECERVRERLLSISNAEPETLLHFLRESCPGWTENIARVMPEELLLRKDLAPSLVTDGLAALYGISIDLSVIDAPRVADEQALKRDIEAAEGQLHKFEEELQQADKLRIGQENAIRKAEKTRESAHALDVQSTSERKASEISLNAAIFARKKDEADDRIRAQTEEKSVRQKLEELRGTDETLKKERKSRRESLDALLAAEIKSSRTVLDDRLKGIDAAIATQKSKLDAALLELDSELEQALKAKGVDTVTLDGHRKSQGQLQKRCSAAEKARDKVHTWKHWLNNEWTKRSRHVEDQRVNETELKVQQEKLAVLKQEDQRYRKGNLDQTDAATKQKAELERLRGICNLRLQKLTVWPANPEVSMRNDYPVRPQMTLEQDMDRLLGEIEVSRSLGKKSAKAMTDPMKMHPGSPPFNFYEQRRLDHGPEDDDRNVFKWHDILREWFGESHVQVRTLLLDRCRTFSGGIQMFHKRLSSFGRKVTGFSTDLQKHMDSAIQFNNIRGVTVRISTSLASIEGWNAIKNMADQYEVWAGTDSEDLPSADFEVAVSQVGQTLKGRHVEVALENLIQIEMDIEQAGQPIKTVHDENQLKDVSSNGLSYLILCVVFVGLINKIRNREPIILLWALDELRDLDFGNVKALLDLLTRNSINLISACPDPDPDVLRLFKYRYDIQDGRKLASVKLAEAAHV